DDQRKSFPTIAARNVEFVISATRLVRIKAVFEVGSFGQRNLQASFGVAGHITQALAKTALSQTIKQSAEVRSHWIAKKPFGDLVQLRHLLKLLDNRHRLFKAPCNGKPGRFGHIHVRVQSHDVVSCLERRFNKRTVSQASEAPSVSLSD